MHFLTVQAISAALSQQWDAAVTLNQKILQDEPGNFDALNRLAYAFSELGRFDEAEEMFTRVLLLDPKNLIATRNLAKLRTGQNHYVESDHDEETNQNINPQLFLDEPGKTKTTNLIRIAAKEILSTLRVGLPVELLLKTRTIAVLASKDTCIGYLPDDISFSLCRFMAGGNQYQAFIKSVAPNTVTIFIREMKQSDTFSNIPSFMDAKKRGTSHIYHQNLEVPTQNIATEDTFEFNDDLEKEMFETE